MDAIFEKHNSVRHYCVERLEAVRGVRCWQDWVTGHFFDPLLYELETFVAADFQSLDELDQFLELAAEDRLKRALDKNLNDYSYVVRRGASGMAEVQEELSRAYQEVLALIRQPAAPSAPPVPYRRALIKPVVARIWAEFEPHERRLTRGGLSPLYKDSRWLEALAQVLITHGTRRLYQLYPGAYLGYELDIAWLTPMFCYDDTYWTATDFSWYIYGDGNGYHYLAGALWEMLDA